MQLSTHPSRQTINSRPIIVGQTPTELDNLLGTAIINDDNIGMPCRHFAVPVSKPHLRAFVRSFSWNCADRLITMMIDETPVFSTYTWIESIGSEQNDAIELVLMDSKDKLVGRIKFSQLLLKEHNCDLVESEENEIQHVRHFVKFRYRLSEKFSAGELLQLEGVTAPIVLGDDEVEEWAVTNLQMQTEVEEDSDQ